jgi:hypothetical protein
VVVSGSWLLGRSWTTRTSADTPARWAVTRAAWRISAWLVVAMRCSHSRQKA